MLGSNLGWETYSLYLLEVLWNKLSKKDTRGPDVSWAGSQLFYPKIDVEGFYKLSLLIYQTTRRYIPKDSNLPKNYYT
jgi:hypothetical protein